MHNISGLFLPLAMKLRQGKTPQADTPPAQCMLRYGQQAGDTHPTGIHYCLIFLINLTNLTNLVVIKEKLNYQKLHV